jgi:hypothetical protein
MKSGVLSWAAVAEDPCLNKEDRVRAEPTRNLEPGAELFEAENAATMQTISLDLLSRRGGTTKSLANMQELNMQELLGEPGAKDTLTFLMAGFRYGDLFINLEEGVIDSTEETECTVSLEDISLTNKACYVRGLSLASEM